MSRQALAVLGPPGALLDHTLNSGGAQRQHVIVMRLPGNQLSVLMDIFAAPLQVKIDK